MENIIIILSVVIGLLIIGLIATALAIEELKKNILMLRTKNKIITEREKGTEEHCVAALDKNATLNHKNLVLEEEIEKLKKQLKECDYLEREIKNLKEQLKERNYYIKSDDNCNIISLSCNVNVPDEAIRGKKPEELSDFIKKNVKPVIQKDLAEQIAPFIETATTNDFISRNISIKGRIQIINNRGKNYVNEG